MRKGDMEFYPGEEKKVKKMLWILNLLGRTRICVGDP